MDILNANSILLSNGVDKDDLMLQIGKMQERIVAKSIFRDLLNTNYENDPVKGGTVKIKRTANAAIQDYGSARTNSQGNSLKNKYAKIDVDVEKEIAEELNAKDAKLFAEEGGLAILEGRRNDFATSILVYLEKAYFTALEQTAQANGLVDVSGGSDLQDKITLLIQALENVENNYVDNVNRENMMITLRSDHYDSLEKVLTTLENPITGRTDEKYFREVPIRRAVRQGYDIVVQHVGAMGQPVVFDDFYVKKPDFSNDLYAFMSFYHGDGAVLDDLVLGADLGDAGISA